MDVVALSVMVAYLVVVTLAGSLLARRVTGSKQWAVAASQMGVLMVAVGIAGTRVGGVATYGVAADVITSGLWNLWYGVNTFLALAFVALFYAVPYRRLRLHTVAEIFWKRFRSRRCQILTSLCVQTEYLIINILEPFVIASILVGVTGMPFGIAVYVAAAVLVTYTALGGLWGSAFANLIHCAVMIVGLSLVLWIGVNAFGGWTEVVSRVNVTLDNVEGLDSESWWSFTGAGWIAIVAMFFSATIHTPAASIYANFSTAARDERSIISAFLLGGLIASLVPFIAGSIGILTFAQYGTDATETGYTLLTRFAAELHPLIGGIALAAVLAAVISSGGPILLSSSTMFVTDWIPSVRQWSSKKTLTAFRVTTIIYGIVAATIAWQGEIGSILQLLLFGFAMVVPPAIAIGFVIYDKSTTEKGAFWGMISGYGIGLVWFVLIRWAEYVGFSIDNESGAFAGLFHTLFVFDGDGIDPSYASTLIPLITVPVISRFDRSAERGSSSEFYGVVSGTRPQVEVS